MAMVLDNGGARHTYLEEEYRRAWCIGDSKTAGEKGYGGGVWQNVTGQVSTAEEPMVEGAWEV